MNFCRAYMEKTSLDTCRNIELMVAGISTVVCIKQIFTAICACVFFYVYKPVSPWLQFRSPLLGVQHGRHNDRSNLFLIPGNLQSNSASVYRKTHDPTCFVCVLLPDLFFYLKVTLDTNYIELNGFNNRALR